MSSNLVTAFLSEFVDPAMQDQASEAMSTLFAQLHMTLAREFIETYSASAPAPAPKKASKNTFPPCTCKTAKGGVCTRKCCIESDVFCAAHLAQSLKTAKAQASDPRMAPPSKKASRAAAPVCSGKTSKGEPCTHKCCAESDIFCSTHLDQFEEISGGSQDRLKSILADLYQTNELDDEVEEFDADWEGGVESLLYGMEEDEEDEEEETEQ